MFFALRLTICSGYMGMKDGVSAGVRHVDPVLRRACLAAPLLHRSPTAALPLHVDGDSVPPASATTASTQETLFNPHGVRVTSIAPKKPWSYCTNHKTFELTPSHVTWTSKEFDSGDSSPSSLLALTYRLQRFVVESFTNVVSVVDHPGFEPQFPRNIRASRDEIDASVYMPTDERRNILNNKHGPGVATGY
uniref:Uncharacterized protein n=1 Tax=Timema poppense TaxID=170557 RepID=A0A7R9D4K5_TIMPO|nr:unnamed protein product [Timema poppensis]